MKKIEHQQQHNARALEYSKVICTSSQYETTGKNVLGTTVSVTQFWSAENSYMRTCLICVLLRKAKMSILKDL